MGTAGRLVAGGGAEGSRAGVAGGGERAGVGGGRVLALEDALLDGSGVAPPVCVCVCVYVCVCVCACVCERERGLLCLRV